MAYRRRGYSRGIRKLLKRARDARTRKMVLRTVSRALYGPRGEDRSIGVFGRDKEHANADQLNNRKNWRFRGKGAYSVNRFIADAGALGEGIKKTYNSWVPKAWRDTISGRVNARLAGGGLYTGRGAYEANSLVAGGDPAVTYGAANDETGSIIVSNREYVTDVYGPSSTRFTNNGVYINPGLQQNFPWLSQVAANYEEYEFIQLLFIYKATIDIGNANTTGQSGSIMMACDYNPSHSAFESKEQMMQYHGAVSGKATDDIVCGVECDPTKNPTLASYIRTIPVPYGEDPKTYDFGLFQFALNNIPLAMQNQQLGELWVEYTCKLKVPKLAVNRGNTIQMDLFASGAAPGTSVSTFVMQPMGPLASLLTAAPSNLGCQISYPTGSTDISQATANILAAWYSPYQQLLGGAGSGATAVTFAASGSNEVDCGGTTGYPNCNQIVNTAISGVNVPRLMITFPVQYNGIAEIIITMNQNGAETLGTNVHSLCPLDFYRGNVKPYRGYLEGTSAVANTTQQVISAGNWFMDSLHSTAYAAGETLIIKLLVDVTSASGGVNNSIMFDFKRLFATGGSAAWAAGANANQGAISSAQIEIKEYNPLFATSGTVDYPQFKNPLGVVTIPPVN